MITQIKGRLVEKSPTELVVDCHGVGYSINISLNTYSQLNDEDSIKLFTHLIVKEDSHTLFGFSTKSERELFKLLISVSGVGASTARTMLSSLTPVEIISSINNEERVLKFFKFLIFILPVFFHARGDPKDPPQPKILIFIINNYLY